MKDPAKFFVWSETAAPKTDHDTNSVTRQLEEAAKQRELIRQELEQREKDTAARNATLKRSI